MKQAFLLFFIGAVATYIILRLLIFIWHNAEVPYIFAIPVFLFAGVVGGFLTGEPIIGAVAGLVGIIPFIYYFLNGTISPIPHFLVSIGGFIGGLLRKNCLDEEKIKRLWRKVPWKMPEEDTY